MASSLSIEERVKIVFLYAEFKNFHEVQRQWKNHFATPKPHVTTMSNIVKKFEQTGSVHDLQRPGQVSSVLTEETIQEVEKMLIDNPNTSVRAGASDMRISPSSFFRAAKEAGFRAYRPHTVVELSDDDFDRREEFCTTFLAMIQQKPGLVDKIIWSGESNFKLNGVINRHNCCYWATANPNYQIAIAEKADGITVWCGIHSGGIVGPFFFEGTMNGARYLDMLKSKVWPLIQRRRMYFHQDGAGPHYAIPVRAWLDEKFPGRWIGRRGPIEWPARSPDLTPCDFFLWGYLKNIVYQERPASIEELRDRITQACSEIPAEMCANACRSVTHRFQRCLDEGGQQQL
jgi:hypothetical protein